MVGRRAGPRLLTAIPRCGFRSLTSVGPSITNCALFNTCKSIRGVRNSKPYLFEAHASAGVVIVLRLPPPSQLMADLGGASH